jgi:hypothetical protein
MVTKTQLSAAFKDAKHLWKSGKGTQQLLPVFIKSKIKWRRLPTTSFVNEFNETRESLDLTTDWFSHNIPRWDAAFKKMGILRNESFTILEIGSWEGLSACFFLTCFPKSTIHSVDTWEGGDEHGGLESVSMAEKRFDQNTAPYSTRVAKFKGTSDQFFETTSDHSLYRIVYIDGSHRAEDVFNDATSGFARLEVGGIMILDDLLWKFYEQFENNPAIGINKFLLVHAGLFQIVDVGHQLYLVKRS